MFSSLARSPPVMQCLNFSRMSRSPKFEKIKRSSQRKPALFTVRVLPGAAFTAALAHKTLGVKVAECAPRKTKTVVDARDEPKKASDWNVFFDSVKRDWFPLLVALATALLSSFCHALMSLYFDDVIPVLRCFVSTGQLPLENMQTSAIRIVALCVAESILSTIYITALAIAFKSSSARLNERYSKERGERSSSRSTGLLRD